MGGIANTVFSFSQANSANNVFACQESAELETSGSDNHNNTQISSIQIDINNYLDRFQEENKKKNVIKFGKVVGYGFSISQDESKKTTLSLKDKKVKRTPRSNSTESQIGIIRNHISNAVISVVDDEALENTTSKEPAYFAELQQNLGINPRTIESIAIQEVPRPVRTLRDVLEILDWAPTELRNQNDDFAIKLIEFLSEQNMLDKITKKPLQIQIGGNDLFLALGRTALEKEIQGWTVSEKDREENPEYYKQYSDRPRLYKERTDKTVLAPEYLKQPETYGRHWDTGTLYKDLLDTSDPSLKNALASKKADIWLCLKTIKDRNIEEISNLPIPRTNIARLGGIIFKQ